MPIVEALKRLFLIPFYRRNMETVTEVFLMQSKIRPNVLVRVRNVGNSNANATPCRSFSYISSKNPWWVLFAC